jgi:hypothetical protein
LDAGKEVIVARAIASIMKSLTENLMPRAGASSIIIDAEIAAEAPPGGAIKRGVKQMSEQPLPLTRSIARVH